MVVAIVNSLFCQFKEIHALIIPLEILLPRDRVCITGYSVVCLVIKFNAWHVNKEMYANLHNNL